MLSIHPKTFRLLQLFRMGQQGSISIRNLTVPGMASFSRYIRLPTTEVVSENGILKNINVINIKKNSTDINQSTIDCGHEGIINFADVQSIRFKSESKTARSTFFMSFDKLFSLQVGGTYVDNQSIMIADQSGANVHEVNATELKELLITTNYAKRHGLLLPEFYTKRVFKSPK